MTFWIGRDGEGYEISLAVRADGVELGRCAHSSSEEEPGVRGSLDEALSAAWRERVRAAFGETVLAAYLDAVTAARARAT